MHVVIRKYKNAAALSAALVKQQQEVRKLISAVPGFAAYYLVADGATVTSITVCRDRAGTDESTRRAAEWVKQNLAGSAIGAPEITQGESVLAF